MAKKYFTDESLATFVDETKSYVDNAVSTKANSNHNHDSAYDKKGSASTVQSNLDAVSDTLNSHTGNSDIHVTQTNKSNWSSAYSHSTSAHAPSNAEKNIIVGIQKNGTDLTVNSSTRKVNITVPTTAAEIGAASSTHNHDDKYDAKGASSSALSSAKTYSDTNLATAKSYTDGKISALLDGADDTTLDSIKELADAIKENDSAIGALNDIASGKANATHSHAISDVSGLQSALDGKAASSHGTHVSFDSTNKPKMDGTAAFGTSSKVARADHVHPTDTSRASQTALDSHTGNSTVHITSTERTNWETAYTHSQVAHAPSNAQPNQNAFSYVKIGETSVAADSATDTLTLVAGTNVTITPDATNDKITISATDTVYTHPASGVTAGTYKSVTVNAQGHVTSGSNPTTLSGYGITDAASKTHKHAISDITNLQSTLNNASSAISANTSSIDAHTTRISELETKVGDGFEEITSADIQALFA